MTGLHVTERYPMPTLVPLGDSALLVRFGTTLTDCANRAAIALGAVLQRDPLAGVVEVAPGLISVLLRFDPLDAAAASIAAELRLRLSLLPTADPGDAQDWIIPVHFDGLDLEAAASALDLSAETFVAAHNARPLRVLATGFAPGFVYCGLHPESLILPRRSDVRPMVPAGTILFAAGQTAITATELPTGWHIIGRADFSNFDPAATPPTQLAPGDRITFSVAS